MIFIFNIFMYAYNCKYLLFILLCVNVFVCFVFSFLSFGCSPSIHGLSELFQTL